MKCSDLKQLKLDESGKIGYTFKTLGSGFWALKQNDFRKAITKIVLQVDILTDSLPNTLYFYHTSFEIFILMFDIHVLWFRYMYKRKNQNSRTSSFRPNIFLVCISFACIIWALSILQYIQLAILRKLFTYSYYFFPKHIWCTFKIFWMLEEYDYLSSKNLYLILLTSE